MLSRTTGSNPKRGAAPNASSSGHQWRASSYHWLDHATALSGEDRESQLRPPQEAYSTHGVARWKKSRGCRIQTRRSNRRYPEEEVHEALPIHDTAHRSSTPRQSPTSDAQLTSTDFQTPEPDVKGRRAQSANGDVGSGVDYTHTCFLCFRDGGHEYTTEIRFVCSKPPTEKKKPTRKKSKPLKANALMRSSKNESVSLAGWESEIMQTIQDAVYRQFGHWKRKLPGYGINNVEECKFSFDAISRDNRARVIITPLDPDAILNKAQKTLASAQEIEFCAGESDCRDSLHHSDECLNDQYYGKLCLYDWIPEATKRFNGYHRRHWLTEYLQDPQRFPERMFLDQGFLQESFVYRRKENMGMPVDAESLTSSGEMRGILVTMGWNVSRMRLHHARNGSVYAMVGLAIVWLASVLWAGPKGDWQTAWAFGQLLAASLTLLLHHT